MVILILKNYNFKKNYEELLSLVSLLGLLVSDSYSI